MKPTGNRGKGPLIAVILGFLMAILGPAVAVTGVRYAMARSFQDIESSPTPTPSDLAGGIHESRLWMIAGILFAVAGLILAIGGGRALARENRDDGSPEGPPDP